MKVDFSQSFLGLDGNPIIENGKNITLGDIAANILLADDQEEKLSGKDKALRGNLAMAIYAAKEPMDLPIEDVALIKDQIGKLATPLIVAQSWKMLEGN